MTPLIVSPWAWSSPLEPAENAGRGFDERAAAKETVSGSRCTTWRGTHTYSP